MSSTTSDKCDHCDKECGSQYLIEVNPEGGWGRPQYLVCEDCLDKAEPGSLMAQVRDTLKRRKS